MNQISQLRARMGISMKEAAARLEMPYTTYVNYEKGTREPNSETLIKLARFFGTSIDELLGKSSETTIPPGFLPLPETERLPLVGRIACGTPILAEENIDDYVDVPKAARATFVLLCQGDSMSPRIQDGDYVYVRKQPAVENGELAAVRIGTEATLKRVYFSPESPDQLILQAENPAYAPMIYTGQELEDVSIEGKIVGIYRNMEHS